MIQIGRRLSPEAAAASERLCSPDTPTPILEGAVERDVPYGAHSRQTLDVYRPASTQRQRAPGVVLFVHGGGFVAGDKRKPGSYLYANVGTWIAEQGYVGVNINYRLAPGAVWPAGADDIASAVAWLQSHQASLGLDASRVIVMGHSAGAAHVASFISRMPTYGEIGRAVRGAVLMSGIYDPVLMLTQPSVMTYFGRGREELERRSAIDGVAGSGLPLLIAVAEEDPDEFQEQALVLASAVRAQRGRLPGFIVVPQQNHYTLAFHLCAGTDQHLSRALATFIMASAEG